MPRKKLSWLFRYHGFQSSEGYIQLSVWVIIFVVGITAFIWLGKLHKLLTEVIWNPINIKLIEIFGEDWGIFFFMTGFFIVLPIGTNLYRHGLNFKKWT